MERPLRDVVGAIVISTMGACQGHWPAVGEGWMLPTCAGEAWTPLAEFTPAVSPDGLELVTVGIDTPSQVQDVLGTPCGVAVDREACAAALASAEQAGAGLVGTTGDTVERWATLDELRGFLGSIDHPTEAMALAFAAGDDVTCGDLDQGAMRESPDGGYDVVTTHYQSICSPIVELRTLRHVSEDAAVDVIADDVVSRSSACVGRRPPGLGGSRVGPGSAAGRWLARAAELEASSVPAFEQLARELAALGAPPELVARAWEAAADEVRHAEVVGALARRHGCEPPAPEVADTALRSLFALCLDNAAEGCVREAWGALAGAWQAATALDPAVRAAMGPIAADETRHAELSFAIAAWAEPRLTPAEQAQVAAARRSAIATLRAEVARDPMVGGDALGLPEGQVGAALLGALEREIWAA